MKYLHLGFTLIGLLGLTQLCRAAVTDTCININHQRLHFTIIKGKGIPILFEAGGANDATTWKDILPAIAQITGAPIIAYDRPGFGLSSLDTIHHSIDSAVSILHQCLFKFGYGGPKLLVGHSLGGFYATLFAASYTTEVKAAVLFDANVINFYTDERKAYYAKIDDEEAAAWQTKNPGIYYIFKDFTHTLDVMSNAHMPAKIPVTDVVSDKTPFLTPADSVAWKNAHIAFCAEQLNRKYLVAKGTGHYVFKDDATYCIMAIVTQYAAIVGNKERVAMLQQANRYNWQLFKKANGIIAPKG